MNIRTFNTHTHTHPFLFLLSTSFNNFGAVLKIEKLTINKIRLRIAYLLKKFRKKKIFLSTKLLQFNLNIFGVVLKKIKKKI